MSSSTSECIIVQYRIITCTWHLCSSFSLLLFNANRVYSYIHFTVCIRILEFFFSYFNIITHYIILASTSTNQTILERQYRRLNIVDRFVSTFTCWPFIKFSSIGNPSLHFCFLTFSVPPLVIDAFIRFYIQVLHIINPLTTIWYY